MNRVDERDGIGAFFSSQSRASFLQAAQRRKARTVVVLRNTVQTPVYPSRLAETVKVTMDQYDASKLSEWENYKMTSWPSSMKVSYGRQKYLQGVIRARAMQLNLGTMLVRMIWSADNMDIERLSKRMSMAMYIAFLKKHDPNVKKRKQNDDYEDPL